MSIFIRHHKNGVVAYVVRGDLTVILGSAPDGAVAHRNRLAADIRRIRKLARSA